MSTLRNTPEEAARVGICSFMAPIWGTGHLEPVLIVVIASSVAFPHNSWGCKMSPFVFETIGALLNVMNPIGFLGRWIIVDTWVKAIETDSHELEKEIEKGAGEGGGCGVTEGASKVGEAKPWERAGTESIWAPSSRNRPSLQKTAFSGGTNWELH